MSPTDTDPTAGSAPSTRPNSSYTTNSWFTDSAISMKSNTPTPLGAKTGPFQAPLSPLSFEISDRLNGLAAAVWSCEQDRPIAGRRRVRLEKALIDMAAALEEKDEESDSENDTDTDPDPNDGQTSARRRTVVESAGNRELQQIRTGLEETLRSMRLRQQEQRHLHELTIEKLEAVAQRCLRQEQRARDLAEEVFRLKERNQYLNQQNENLKDELDQEQTESMRKEVAVSAMTSAVAGLEGWINSSLPAPNYDSRKYVMRGRGRFRGRYYLEDGKATANASAHDRSADAKALHEGVNSWLRGFRDVEEELRSSQSPTPRRSQFQILDDTPHDIEDDDWGEFETAEFAS